MSKKILPFPLNMKNGAKVRTIEDLRANADIDSILGFYLDGKLSRWCQAFRYEELPPKIDGITEASIRKLYEILGITVNEDELKTFLENNVALQSGTKSGSSDEETEVVDSGEIKSQLEKFVDKEINLSDYAIETSPIINEDGKVNEYKISIKNEKAKIYQSFFLPYSVNNDDDKKAWNENLIKKISHGIKKINEIVTYNGKDLYHKLGEDFVFIEDNDKTSAFYICDHQVTQKEWQDIMGNNPSNFKGDNRPVECVSWYDAIEYCNKRSEKEGLTPCYTRNGDDIKCDFNANGYRLPTEAEWEYAARGGNKSGGYRYSGNKYSCSNIIKELEAYLEKEKKGEETHDVKQKKPNELGIYDMTGNVWEWCWDWYEDNPKSSKDYAGPSSGSNRVLRGGRWCDDEKFGELLDCINRSNPGDCISYLGFRVVRSKRD